MLRVVCARAGRNLFAAVRSLCTFLDVSMRIASSPGSRTAICRRQNVSNDKETGKEDGTKQRKACHAEEDFTKCEEVYGGNRRARAAFRTKHFPRTKNVFAS